MLALFPLLTRTPLRWALPTFLHCMLVSPLLSSFLLEGWVLFEFFCFSTSPYELSTDSRFFAAHTASQYLEHVTFSMPLVTVAYQDRENDVPVKPGLDASNAPLTCFACWHVPAHLTKDIKCDFQKIQAFIRTNEQSFHTEAGLWSPIHLFAFRELVSFLLWHGH